MAIFTAKGTFLRESTSFEPFCVNVVNVLVQPVISMRGLDGDEGYVVGFSRFRRWSVC